jgi:drug/metabolite transporter (DMT)-like permease
MAKKTALFLLVLTAFLWSSSGILIKNITWNPMALASARGLLAGLTIWFLNPGVFKPRSLQKMHFYAGGCLALLSVCFISSMQLTAVANTVVLQFTAPIWVAIFAPLFLKERTSLKDFVFIAIIFGGIILFFVDKISPTGFWGNILAIVSGFFFASMAMCLRRLKDDSPVNAMIVGNLLCFAMGLGFWGPPWPDLVGIACILLLGFIQLGLSYHIYCLALLRVSSLELVMVTMLEPVLSPLWVFLFMNEVPGPFALMGGFIVILAVTVWSLLKAKEETGLPAKALR